MEVLKKMEIKSLWVVVDEIEDVTDVVQDVPVRRIHDPIKQELLTVIPRVIKARTKPDHALGSTSSCSAHWQWATS